MFIAPWKGLDGFFDEFRLEAIMLGLVAFVSISLIDESLMVLLRPMLCFYDWDVVSSAEAALYLLWLILLREFVAIPNAVLLEGLVLDSVFLKRN